MKKLFTIACPVILATLGVALLFIIRKKRKEKRLKRLRGEHAPHRCRGAGPSVLGQRPQTCPWAVPDVSSGSDPRRVQDWPLACGRGLPESGLRLESMQGTGASRLGRTGSVLGAERPSPGQQLGDGCRGQGAGVTAQLWAGGRHMARPAPLPVSWRGLGRSLCSHPVCCPLLSLPFPAPAAKTVRHSENAPCVLCSQMPRAWRKC